MANELKFLIGDYTNWSGFTKNESSFYIVKEQDGRLSFYLGDKFLCDGVSKADLANAITNLVNGAEEGYDTLGGLEAKVKVLEAAVGEGGSVAAQITAAIEKLDAEVTSTGDTLVTVKVTEVDGKLDTVVVTTNDIAKASELDALEAAVGTAIAANKKAIEDEAARAESAETANADAIAKLNGNVQTEGSVAKAVADAKNELLGDAATDYNTLGKLEDKVLAVEAAAKSYEIKAVTNDLGANVKEAFALFDEDGTQAGATINIYKDSALKSVELVSEKPEEGVEGEDGYVPSEQGQFLKFIYLTTKGEENVVYINVSSFLSEEEFGDGLDVSANGVVSVNVADATKENTVATVESGKNFLELEADGDGNQALAVRSVDTDSTILQKDIVVAGMSAQFGAGNYENNDVIPAGTDIYTILQNILCKELYATPSNTTGSINASIAQPTVSLDKSGTVEVGTLVTMNSATVANSTVATTGQSVNGMTYGYSVADDDSVDFTDQSISKSWTTAATGNAYKMSASVSGFNADTTTNVQTTPATVNAQSMDKTVLGCAAEGSNTIKVSVTGDTFTGSVDGIDSVYHCSNLGNTDAAKKTTAIAAITDAESNAPTNSKTVTVTGVYKYFMGYSTNTAFDQFDSASVRALTTKTGNVTKDSTTTIVDATAITSNGQSIVVACPSKYKLATVNNGVGANIIDNFTTKGSYGSVDVTTGNITTKYNVYVYPITNGATVEFKNLTLTNA